MGENRVIREWNTGVVDKGLTTALTAASGGLEAVQSVRTLIESVVDIIESTVRCDYVALLTLDLSDLRVVDIAERQSPRCCISVSPARLRSLLKPPSEPDGPHGDLDLQLAADDAASLFVALSGAAMSQGLLFARPREGQALIDLAVLGASSSSLDLARYLGFVGQLLHSTRLTRAKLAGSGRGDSEHRRVVQAKMEWQASVDAMEQLICLVDRDGRVLRANKALEDCGLGRVTDIQGHPVTELLNTMIDDARKFDVPSPADLPPQVFQRFTDGDWQRRWNQMVRGGSVRWTMSSSTGMHSYRVTIRPCEMGHALDDFSSSYAVFVVEDITAQVAAKKLVVNFRTELEREIRQKTADLQEANARLVKLSRQTLSIQEAERSRVARDLHDGIGQSLTTMKFYIDNLLSDNAQQNPSWPLKEVTWLRDRVSHAIGETRRIAMNLRPAMLDDLGLGPTLSWFFREYQESIGSIRVRSHVAPDEAGLDPERKTAIFRVVQEALCNVAKHANASEVRVQLAVVNGSHALLIVDNGQGFDPSRVSRHAGGHGLDDIRQRVKMTGGALKIIAAKGAGVKLVARWR